jgi:hypothetical protein
LFYDFSAGGVQADNAANKAKETSVGFINNVPRYYYDFRRCKLQVKA